MGLFDFLKRKPIGNGVESLPLDDLDRQIEELSKERETVNASDDLAPEILAGKKRRYHYKDVNIWIKWQYGGHYGKSCESIGMKRGDALDLMPPQEKDDDPETIAVCWKGIEIGFMKSNRLRSMVHQWKAAGLPVLAFVSEVGGEEKLYIEFAFYSAPKKSKPAP